MSGIVTQWGVVTESTYNVPVAVTRFYEFLKCSMDADIDRIRGEGLRATSDSERSDRSVPYIKGAGGTVEHEVLTKSFGLLFGHCLALPVTTGPTDSVYTHTITAALGSTNGRFFTGQAGKTYAGITTANPFTYGGCKIKSFEISCDRDGLLLLTVDIDAASEAFPSSPAGAYVLQAASYASGAEIMPYFGGTVSIGGTAQTNISKVSIKVDNGLDTDRRFLQGTAAKKEPLQKARRKITTTMTQEFNDRTHYDRFTSVTAAGAQAAVVARWQGPTLAGATTYPSLTATMAAVDFTGKGPLIEGPGLLTQEVSGDALWPAAGGSSLVLAYASTDATP